MEESEEEQAGASRPEGQVFKHAIIFLFFIFVITLCGGCCVSWS